MILTMPSLQYKLIKPLTTLRIVGLSTNIERCVLLCSFATRCLLTHWPLPLCISVLAKMIPTVLYARIGNATRLVCSVHYRGYAWSTINIVQKNTTDSVLLINVSSDGNVESKNSRIYGLVNKDNEYINVTVSFDVSPGSGVCELNHTYSCDIQLNDASIGTIATDTLFILESKYEYTYMKIILAILHTVSVIEIYELKFNIMPV